VHTVSGTHEAARDVTDATRGTPSASEPGSRAVRFAIDTRVSKFTVQAFASGLLSALGHNPTFAARDYYGEIACDPETGGGASLELTIKAASLQLTDDDGATERETIERKMQEEALESAKHPAIAYDAPPEVTTVKRRPDGSYDVTMNGNLTLHGVTRRHPIKARVEASSAMLRASGEFTIRQTDFEITPVSAMGGTLKVKDELECTFDMVAHPAPAPNP
jgi:polyisoprenoid-binding protein YceI